MTLPLPLLPVDPPVPEPTPLCVPELLEPVPLPETPELPELPLELDPFELPGPLSA